MREGLEELLVSMDRGNMKLKPPLGRVGALGRFLKGEADIVCS